MVRPNGPFDPFVSEWGHLLQAFNVHALSRSRLSKCLLGTLRRHCSIVKLSLFLIDSILAITLEQIDLLVGKHALNFANSFSDIIQRQQAIQDILQLEDFGVTIIIVKPTLDPNAIVSLEVEVFRQVIYNHALRQVSMQLFQIFEIRAASERA